jgi:putative spermidine/putrescine transport system permease protein
MSRIGSLPEQKIIEKRRKAVVIFFTVLIVYFLLVWIGLPSLMAVLWSLVDPDHPWSYPQVFPSHLSLAQWRYVARFTDIGRAIVTSYSLAPIVTFVVFLLSLPTAYVLGRRRFTGRDTIKLLILLPIVMPGMVVALFLSRVFFFLRLDQNFIGLVLAHSLVGIPYMLRILTASFEAIPQDIIDAAENLGASQFAKFQKVVIPMIAPGLFAGAIFTFITSLEEFNLTFVIGTPTFVTIPTILFSFLGRDFIRSHAAVASLILVVPNIIMLFIAERLLKTEYLAAAFGKM